MTSNKSNSQIGRFGMYWFVDDENYRNSEQDKWLREIIQMNLSWLVLYAPPYRAIPEPFILKLLNSNIEPILFFRYTQKLYPSTQDFELLIKSYARWGIKYAILFNTPNLSTTWDTPVWTKSNLVEQFLDLFLPLSEITIEKNITPIFPPCTPGGDYWDLSFLKLSLAGIQRRKSSEFLEKIAISAYIDTISLKKSLEWGKGGPERWPETKPYLTPQGQEDHRGLYIHEWYNPVVKAIIGKTLPMFLLDINHQSFNPSHGLTAKEISILNKKIQKITKMCLPISNDSIRDNKLENNADERFPQNCKAFIFPSIFYKPEQSNNLEIIPEDKIIKLIKQALAIDTTSPKNIPKFCEAHVTNSDNSAHIDHYLLLPIYEWGVSEWHLEAIRPFVLLNKPTVGFSLCEASQAKKVTIVGSTQVYSEEEIQQLLDAGCSVERLVLDGTRFASERIIN